MDYMTVSVGDAETTGESPGEGLFPDPGSGVIEGLLARAEEEGLLNYEGLVAALPRVSASSVRIEDTMTALSELGIRLLRTKKAES